MLTPSVPTPFPLAWGFSTKRDARQPLPLQRVHQIHGTGIQEASEAVPDGDGLWTMRPQYRIGVRTADCVPVLLAGLLEGAPWIAALHAGWRSAVGGNGTGGTPGILRVCVEQFRHQGGNPGALTWALGPSIQKCHFEVGEEVLQAAAKDPAWEAGLRSLGPRGRPHLDLQGFLRRQAWDLGLDPTKDGSIDLCTVCTPDLLWSYRRDDWDDHHWGWIEIL
jgi:YfiH family protein